MSILFASNCTDRGNSRRSQESRNMATLSFNFSNLENRREALDSLQCKRQCRVPPIDNSHLAPLQQVADELGPALTGPRGLVNAKALAKGHNRDIVVILQEPTKGASTLEVDEMVKKSDTITWIDKILRRSSEGLRTWKNTRIFDTWPFGDTNRKRAYHIYTYIFEEMMRLAQPDVVLVCQCQTSTARSKIANYLSSSIATADQIRVEDILGHKTVVVNAFHPSSFLRSNWANDVEKDDLQGRERYPDLCESLLEVAFLTAVNAAVGRRITGFGNENLSLAALNGHTQAEHHH